jgi:hypothetical protein
VKNKRRFEIDEWKDGRVRRILYLRLTYRGHRTLIPFDHPFHILLEAESILVIS